MRGGWKIDNKLKLFHTFFILVPYKFIDFPLISIGFRPSQLLGGKNSVEKGGEENDFSIKYTPLVLNVVIKQIVYLLTYSEVQYTCRSSVYM